MWLFSFFHDVKNGHSCYCLNSKGNILQKVLTFLHLLDICQFEGLSTWCSLLTVKVMFVRLRKLQCLKAVWSSMATFGQHSSQWVKQFSVLYGGPKIWNLLPISLTSSFSSFAFEKNLKNYSLIVVLLLKFYVFCTLCTQAGNDDHALDIFSCL